MRRVLIALAAVGACASTAHAAPQKTITTENAQFRASLGNAPNSAAYLTVRNSGKTADRLVGVSCACAAMVMTHNTVTTNGVAKMAADPSPVIPAGGALTFAPGGRHIMLMGLKKPIRAGETVTMTLKFEKAGAVDVAFKATDTPGMDHHH